MIQRSGLIWGNIMLLWRQIDSVLRMHAHVVAIPARVEPPSCWRRRANIVHTIGTWPNGFRCRRRHEGMPLERLYVYVGRFVHRIAVGKSASPGRMISNVRLYSCYFVRFILCKTTNLLRAGIAQTRTTHECVCIQEQPPSVCWCFR